MIGSGNFFNPRHDVPLSVSVPLSPRRRTKAQTQSHQFPPYAVQLGVFPSYLFGTASPSPYIRGWSRVSFVNWKRIK